MIQEEIDDDFIVGEPVCRKYKKKILSFPAIPLWCSYHRNTTVFGTSFSNNDEIIVDILICDNLFNDHGHCRQEFAVKLLSLSDDAKIVVDHIVNDDNLCCGSVSSLRKLLRKILRWRYRRIDRAINELKCEFS